MKFNKKFITVLLLLITTGIVIPTNKIIAKDITMINQNTDSTNEVNLKLSSALAVKEKVKCINYTLENGSVAIVTEEMAKQMDQTRKEKALEEQKRRERETITVSSEVISITEYTNLSAMRNINVDQMNQIIDYWDTKSGGTPFKGKGQVFIDASKASGLDPVYILAHAATESGWGKLHMSHNYFGIGAYDSNPDNAHNYGKSDISEGIIEGAMWIKTNFYDLGQSSLHEMNYPSNSSISYHIYSTSGYEWINQILNIMQTSYSLI